MTHWTPPPDPPDPAVDDDPLAARDDVADAPDPTASATTRYLPATGSLPAWDPRGAPPHDRTRLLRDLGGDLAADSSYDPVAPPPTARHGRDPRYRLTYEGTTGLVVVCALALLALVLVVLWVG